LEAPGVVSPAHARHFRRRPQSGSSPPSSMLPRSVGGEGYHYTTHDPGAWAPGGPAPLAAPVQDHRRTDLARLEQVMHEEIESANAEAQAKGCVARRYPVARVKHIMKSSMRPQRRVTITHDAVLAMTNLSQVMTGCIAKVAWERTKQRCAGSSSSHCVKLVDVVSATGSMPQFDFLIDVNSAAIEEKRRAEQQQEARRQMQQFQAMREQQAVLVAQLNNPTTTVHGTVATAMPPPPPLPQAHNAAATDTVNGTAATATAAPPQAYNLAVFAPSLQMP